uniref:Protein kinase domain-containing protein n=1 Tax=Accipiter nisus TaxID=211598 RepID=A0A8B9MSM3_9AVES
MSVLQICCRCPPSLLLVLCSAKIGVNLPDPGTGCKADLGSNRGVSVCPPGGGSPFTSTRFVSHAHAGLHRHSCGFTLPCKAAGQVPPACEFVWGWSEPLESTWVAAPHALAPLDWQARRNCFGSLTNRSLLEGYRAFTEANDGSMCLAMEYGGEKSLNDLIEERSAERLGPFPAATIFKVALSMARGLKYLHNDKKLLHGDIKSSNVVVKGDFEAIKICDVGVSLPLDENMTVSDPEMYYIGTEPWKPKEALQDDGVITDKADIFPFGLTLWEMMTLSVPHLNLDDNPDDEGLFLYLAGEQLLLLEMLSSLSRIDICSMC